MQQGLQMVKGDFAEGFSRSCGEDTWAEGKISPGLSHFAESCHGCLRPRRGRLSHETVSAVFMTIFIFGGHLL